jgi:PAS domain S-box-containing protein
MSLAPDSTSGRIVLVCNNRGCHQRDPYAEDSTVPATTQKSDPTSPWREEDRLAALRSYGILDTPSEPAFDEITRVAALVCKAPIAVVNLIEDTRQFFKSEIGLGVRETPVDVSICAHAILQRDLFVVPDTTKDPRFACNPLVTGEPHLRFYAGALLQTPEGLPLGTVCVLDYKPRPDGITEEQGETLRALARAAMAQIELRRSSRALAEGEAKFRAITDSVDQMIWSTGPNGYHDFYNQRWYEYTGVPEGSTDGEEWNGMFHPDDQERAWATWRHCLATGEPYHIEYRLRHRSGQYRWVLGRAQPMRSSDGRITRWFGTCTDIHDLKLAQEALQGSEERFRTLTEAMPALVFSCDEHGNNDYTNHQYQAYTGLSADELLGNGWLTILHPDDHARTREVWEGTRRSGSPYEVEYRLRAADGSYRWFLGRAASLRNPAGGVERWLGACIDIHDRKEGEAANARLAAIVSSSSDAIVSFAAGDGRILTWNRGAEEMFGYTAEEAIGAPLNLLAPQGGSGSKRRWKASLLPP